MYEQLFGLTRRPFPPTPDPSLYYPATTHENALAALQQGLDGNEGVLLLTGATGSGKTLLGYVLIERLPNACSAFLTNSRLQDRTALLQAMLFDLGLPYSGGAEQDLRLRLTDGLLSNWASGRRTVIVVDEAHYLSADLLEELRLLGNLEAGRGKAVQVVLLAQPAILDTLCKPELQALQQRLAVKASLEPLGLEEGLDYLLHHLRVAGDAFGKSIDEAACEILTRGSKGIPRVLNQVAQQALLLAGAGELACVDAEAALEALSLLSLSEDTDTPAPSNEAETSSDVVLDIGAISAAEEQGRAIYPAPRAA